MTTEQRALQAEIVAQLGASAKFDAAYEAKRRIVFLSDYLSSAGLRAFVLGISGGVDSLVAGLLAQQAAQRLRNKQAYEARFIAMRLPYGHQHDESDAQACLDVIKPDRVLCADVQAASDALMAALHKAGLQFSGASQQDFVHGNIKARQRMVAQFAVAGAQAGLVIGTDQAAESLMGFFTKFGDGAADVMPLRGLNKRQVRALGRYLGAPERLVDKVPTADLESLAPLRADEEMFGVTYSDIDDFLEGKEISAHACAIILRHWHASGHKRRLPPGPLP